MALQTLIQLVPGFCPLEVETSGRPDPLQEGAVGIEYVVHDGVTPPRYSRPARVDIAGLAATLATSPDDSLTNVGDLTFKEHEGSFLVGAAAALKCECDTIGFLGGQTGPLIEKFEAGYVAGAQQVNPDIEVLVEYIGDDTTAFNNATAGEALSTQMYDDGAEIIYHAAGASGPAVGGGPPCPRATVRPLMVSDERDLTRFLGAAARVAPGAEPKLLVVFACGIFGRSLTELEEE